MRYWLTTNCYSERGKIIEIKVGSGKQLPGFSCPVIPDPGHAEAFPAVRNIKLMAVSPGTSLFYFRTFEVHSSAAEVSLDEVCEGSALDEGSQHFYRKSEEGGYAGDIGLGAGGLEMEKVAGMYGLPVLGGNPQAHAGRNQEGIFAILLEFDIHNCPNAKIIAIYAFFCKR